MMARILPSVLVVLLCGIAALGQDVRLKILEQPRPELPTHHGTLDVQGSVILKVQFLEFGEVGEVTVIKQLPAGLTQRAIEAVRKIKFEPEKSEGKAVTVERTLEYAYSWNGGWRIVTEKPFAAKPAGEPEKAEAIVAKAVSLLGGDRYLNVRSQVGKGKFSTIQMGMVASFQSFLDIIVFPDRERTEFKGNGSRFTQVNTGETGWVFDGDTEIIKDQDAAQVANFKRSIRSSLDSLLRGYWKGNAEIAYAGRRQASLGKRNDVVRLTYEDGFIVEFEFDDDGMPQKALYSRRDKDGDEFREEDRYAQFIEVSGIKAPFIIDRFTNGKASSRINFESIEYNRTIPDSVWTKPTNVKDAKKDVKY